MDPFMEKVRHRRINDKYYLVRKIGEGGYGAVYLAKDTDTEEEVALKLEHRDHDPSTLSSEFDYYGEFRSTPGFPRVDWYGWHDDFKVMALELLGPSLEDVLAYCGGRFSLKTTLMLVDQLLERLKVIHSRGYLHCDIKPSNFLLGTGAYGNTVYAADFGLMRPFWPERKTSKESDNKVSRGTVFGTVRFASIRDHTASTRYPRDDLESLCYMLVYFMKGKLPWQGLQVKEEERNQRILDVKNETSADELCAGLPREFMLCVKHAKKLKAGMLPNYDKMLSMFRSLAEKEGLSYDNVFDWTERFVLNGGLG